MVSLDGRPFLSPIESDRRLVASFITPQCCPKQTNGMCFFIGLWIQSSDGRLQLVELKNGETFNGHLVNCDNFMNITLREVYQTSPEGDKFWKLKECYIRGSTVRFYSRLFQVATDISEKQDQVLASS